jgi:predicted RND superfamily exporter protein
MSSEGESPRWAIRLVDLLHRRAAVFITILVVATLALGWSARKIGIDNSLKVWFVEGDPALKAYDDYKEQFGNDETIVVAVTAPDGIYDAAYLTRIRAAAEALRKLPRVREVQSLATSLHATDMDGELEVGTLVPESGPITDADAAAVKVRVAANPGFHGVLVGDNETISVILVEPRDTPDYEKTRKDLIDQVQAIAKTELAQGGSKVHYGGIGVVYQGLNDASLRDTTVFVTLSYLILMFGLWVIFRRIVWVAIGAAIVSVAVLATMGIAGLAGRDMNMVTGIVPTLIMTVGVLDLIHLVDSYEEGVASGFSRAQILRTTVALTVVPCIINSFTDVIGFASFVTAPVGAIRDLGWMVGVGLTILLIAVLVIGIPALAKFGGRSKRAAEAAIVPADRGLLGRIILGLLAISTRHRNKVLLAAVALFAISAVGMSRLKVDTYTIGFLPADHQVRRDHDAIEKQFGAYVPLELTATTVDERTLFEPEVMTAIERIERKFEENPRIGRVTGVPEIVEQSFKAYTGDPADYRIPDKRAAITQLLDEVYGQSKDGEDHLNAVLDDRLAPHVTHMTARSGLPSANTISTLLDDLRARAAPEASTVKVEPAGYLPLYVRITQNITNAQISSAFWAFLLVAVIMILLLRSVKLGLLSMVPNLLPAVMTLGWMGFTGVPLDLATVLIAGIVIGISVNDTSHIMFRYQHELRQSPDDPQAALRRMMISTGRPVVMASLTLIAGFAVLIGASVKSVYYFGLLTVVTTSTALISDLVVTPALLLWVARSRRPKLGALAQQPPAS